jgi:hypothetical protein
MIDEVALSGNMCFIFTHRTLHKHILLMQSRGVCTLEMGFLLIIGLWLKGNQIEYSFTTVTTLLPKISLCMLHQRQVVGMCSERSCTSFHSLFSYKLFYWFEQYSYVKVQITWKTCNLESFVKNVRLQSIIIPRRYVKWGKADVDIHMCLTFPNIERERVNCELWLQDCYERNLSFHCRLHLLPRIYSWRNQLEGKVPIIHDTKE